MNKLACLGLSISAICLSGLGYGATAPDNTAAAKPSNAQALVSKISGGDAQIVTEFKAIAGLNGLVLSSKKATGQKIVAFTDANYQYIFVGNVVDAQGQNYTQAYTQQYISAPEAKDVMAKISGATQWVTEGDDKAPHKLYVMFDPNCVYCHLLYQQTRSFIDSKQVQIRWIPVAFLHPSSAGKAAMILSGNTNADRVNLLAQNEATFNSQEEEGGVTALKADQSPSAKTAFQAVQQNTAFFGQYSFAGTPVLILKQEDGTPVFFPGLLPPEQLKKTLLSANASF